MLSTRPRAGVVLPVLVLVLALALAAVTVAAAGIGDDQSSTRGADSVAAASGTAEGLSDAGRTARGARGGEPRGPRGERPNVVLISTDDMTNSDLEWMPTVRRLLTEQGTTFENALSPHPLCCPARGAILTGQYAQNNHVKSNQAPYNYVALDNTTTLPVWLHEAGYRTAFTGKYLNGFGTNGPRQPGWDFWDPSMFGQYAYTPFQMYNNGDRTWYRDVNNVDYITDRTVSLIKEWSGPDQPFFIWASHVAPHGRLDKVNGISSSAVAYPPDRFATEFTGVESPSLRDPGYLVDDVSDNNSLVQSKNLPGVKKINEIFRSRIRSLQGVDEGIATILDELRRQGELDHTYIIFTSDNGFLLGEHHLVTKNVPYSQSLRVPMIIRGPGVAAGAVSDERALMIDVAPTVADLAGAEPLVPVDGVSLMPALREGASLRDTVLIQAGPSKQTDDGGTGWWWRGVTTPRYTYAHFYADELEELYDHEVDPSENHNLADDPDYAHVLAVLRERTEALEDCTGPAQCSKDFGADPLPEG